MKAQKVNSNNLNPMQMNSMSSMIGTMNLIQRIGKGKRKYSISLDKNTKKILSKFVDEVKKHFVGNGEMPNLTQFFDYIKTITDSKNENTLMLSYEEQEFLAKMISDSIKGIDTIKFKWYQFMKKALMKIMAKQYRELHTQLKK